MSKKVIICIMGLIYFYFAGAAFANSTVSVSSDSNSFSLFLTDISSHKPFLEIRRLPKAPNLQVTIPPRANDLRRFPFFLFVDSNLNGKSDLEFSPMGLSFLEKGLVGFQVNSSSPATAKGEMPYFDRIELQIHDSLRKDSPLQIHGYKIDLIVIRGQMTATFKLPSEISFFARKKTGFLKPRFVGDFFCGFPSNFSAFNFHQDTIFHCLTMENRKNSKYEPEQSRRRGKTGRITGLACATPPPVSFFRSRLALG